MKPRLRAGKDREQNVGSANTDEQKWAELQEK